LIMEVFQTDEICINMQRLSLLRKEHELQIKSLRMHHEEECQRMQEELELQKSKVVIA
jgi:hypothetical protein